MIARVGEVEAFRDAVVGTGQVRVELERLHVLWSHSAPRLIASPTQIRGLSEAISELAESGTVELPTSAWDRTTTPALPRFVSVPSARRSKTAKTWLNFPWIAELGWVASIKAMSESRFADLVKLNAWLLRAGTDPPTLAPMRYRSVEIFGREKLLEAMLTGELFGAGRLTLEMLRCTRFPAPVPGVVVGDGPDVIVVENSDTYWAVLEILRSPGLASRIGILAWGLGNAFPSQVSSLVVDLAGRGPVTGTVWYWGDLDPGGVDTAGDAVTAAERYAIDLRLPVELWSALADCPVQDEGRVRWESVRGQDRFGSTWSLFADVIERKGRVAQEAVPSARLRVALSRLA